MTEGSRPKFDHLPPHVRHDPHMVSWRLDHHEDRLHALETREPASIKTPLGSLPWPVAVIILGLLLWLRPELAEKLILGAFGQ